MTQVKCSIVELLCSMLQHVVDTDCIATSWMSKNTTSQSAIRSKGFPSSPWSLTIQWSYGSLLAPALHVCFVVCCGEREEGVQGGLPLFCCNAYLSLNLPRIIKITGWQQLKLKTSRPSLVCTYLAGKADPWEICLCTGVLAMSYKTAFIAKEFFMASCMG